MDVSALLPSQRPIALAANLVIKTRYGLRDALVNQPISPSLKWRPTLLWATKTEYIACEVADRPFPTTIKILFSDISATGLPIRIIVAYPSPPTISTRDYLKDITTAKRSGIGYLSVEDSNNGKLDYMGIPISLYLPKPTYNGFRACLRKTIADSYELYLNVNPSHGVQELGQIVEDVIVNLATQAKRKGALTTGGFPPATGKHYPFTNLVDDLSTDRIIDRAILGKCRGFASDRNKTSHKPKSIKQAKNITGKLRGCFLLGLQILEELPDNFKDKSYVFRFKQP